MASDQGLHCLLTGFIIKNRIKATKETRHPQNDKRTSPTCNSGKVHQYTTGLIWVQHFPFYCEEKKHISDAISVDSNQTPRVAVNRQTLYDSGIRRQYRRCMVDKPDLCRPKTDCSAANGCNLWSLRLIRTD